MQSFKLLFANSVIKYCQIHLPSATRKASNYRRPYLNYVPQVQLEELKSHILKNRVPFTTKEWQAVQENFINNYKHINADNVDTTILGICRNAEHLPLAVDYLRYLRESGVEPNIATLGRLLRVYNTAYHARGGTTESLSQQEQEEILEIYRGVRKKHDVLDATTCESLILGLVGTIQWADCQELLEMMRITATPSLAAYTELIVKAFSMAKMQLGWQLLEEMVQLRKMPKCEILIAYLDAISKNGQNFPRQFEKLLLFIEKNELVLTQRVGEYMEEVVRRGDTGITISIAKLNRLGQCDHCENYMQNVSISDADFNKLSVSFLQKVLIRNDVFQKSTPEEVEGFKRFVAQTGPYDCVIDGLNVAYACGSKKPPQFLAHLLASVVKYFKNKNKHVLVLGRKHMNNWPKDKMQFIRKNSSIFLTNNLTHDDPFMLYATIKSGPTTDFFSRDLMRSHAHLLGPELKTIFRRWQQEHQYSLVTQTESGKIIVKEPVRHLISAHKVADTWHLPSKLVYEQYPSDTFEIPTQWVCVKLQH